MQRDLDSDQKVRQLIEQGDLGVPSSYASHPVGLGNSERAKIWRAAVGETSEIYQRHVAHVASQIGLEAPHIYLSKIRARRKLGKFRTADGRRTGVQDVSLNDNDVLPRHISKEEFFNLYGAIAFANRCGLILNVHVTISWKLLGVTEHAAIAKTLSTGFIKHYSEWCRDRELPCVWIYSNEVGERLGLHTHFLTAVPLEMRAAFRAWAKKRPYKLAKESIPVKAALKVVCPPSNPIGRQWRMFQYLCKGISPHAEMKSVFDDGATLSVLLADLIQYEYESPGEMGCKREGVSVNLGGTARLRAGFRSLLECSVADIRRLYSDEEYRKFLLESSTPP